MNRWSIMHYLREFVVVGFFKANCPFVGLGPIGGVPSMEVFTKNNIKIYANLKKEEYFFLIFFNWLSLALFRKFAAIYGT